MPKLSIIIPTYFAEKTLAECLSAIHASLYKNYELIVIDDASTDNTIRIAKQFVKHIVHNPTNLGKIKTRRSGLDKAKGEILINIDQDVVIKPNTFNIIVDYFKNHPEVDAITCLLSKEEPFTNFTSQYKNLYMHYYFKRLPETVHFLYGSLYAIRRTSLNQKGATIKAAEDTEEGQIFIENGKIIALPKNLEVVHLKEYTLKSLIKNDFIIPFGWAQIFLKYRGWRQLGRNKTGFAHASKEQIISLVLIPFIIFSFLTQQLLLLSLPLVFLLLFFWFLLNISFFYFLTKERGVFFGIQSIVFTFVDHLVMTLGILSGVVKTISI